MAALESNQPIVRIYEADDGFRGTLDQVVAHEKGLTKSLSAQVLSITLAAKKPHPTYKATLSRDGISNQVVSLHRFADFQSLHDTLIQELTDAGLAASFPPFPKRFVHEKLGFSLSDKALEERALGLEKWMQRLVALIDNLSFDAKLTFQGFFGGRVKTVVAAMRTGDDGSTPVDRGAKYEFLYGISPATTPKAAPATSWTAQPAAAFAKGVPHPDAAEHKDTLRVPLLCMCFVSLRATDAAGARTIKLASVRAFGGYIGCLHWTDEAQVAALFGGSTDPDIAAFTEVLFNETAHFPSSTFQEMVRNFIQVKSLSEKRRAAFEKVCRRHKNRNTPPPHNPYNP
jgi:hypothetical protein